MSLEREAKFSTWPGFELPDLDRVLPSVSAGARSEARLDATYWDTPDLRLIRWGITVRHRAQGGHGEWTVKLPGTVDDGVLSRPEYNFDGPPGEIPFEVRDLVRAYARTTPLEPVARLQTLRRSLPLFDPRGHRIAEVADDEVSVLDGDRVAARFREVELEVVETAPPTLLPALIERVRAAGAGQPDPTPKLVRALGPRALAAPELSVPGLDDTANVGAVLRAAMSAAVLRILHHDAIVRLDSGPEGVHQARVGTRRLRSDLRTFAPILDETWVEALREELSWLAEALGRVRDADVLLARLERASKELAAQDQRLAESVRMRLRRQRAVHRRALLEVLRSDAYVVLLDRLVEAARSPRLSEAAGQAAKDALPALVRRPWKKLTKAVEDLEADGAVEHRHEVRIRGKRVRYAADAATLASKEAAPMAKALAEMQDVLGEEHDAVVAEEWLRAIAVTNVSRAEALVIGMLIAVEQREARVGGEVARRVGCGLQAQGASVAELGEIVPPDAVLRAAGGVVWRVAPSGAVEIVVVHRPGYDDWTFPKGKREPRDESDEACALREVDEETGYRCVLGRELASVEYLDRKQRRKQVRYWEMTVASGEFRPTFEVDRIRWVSVAEASKVLTYPRDRDVLDTFASFAGIGAART